MQKQSWMGKMRFPVA